MGQLTLSNSGFEFHHKLIPGSGFLAEMEMELVVPWSSLCALFEPNYPKGECGRPPIGVERMLHI